MEAAWPMGMAAVTLAGVLAGYRTAFVLQDGERFHLGLAADSAVSVVWEVQLFTGADPAGGAPSLEIVEITSPGRPSRTR